MTATTEGTERATAGPMARVFALPLVAQSVTVLGFAELREANGEPLAEFGFDHQKSQAHAIARAVNAHDGLVAAAREFIAPYAEITDETLTRMAGDRHGSTFTVRGTINLTRNVAKAILAFRAAIAAAEGRS